MVDNTSALRIEATQILKDIGKFDIGSEKIALRDITMFIDLADENKRKLCLKCNPDQVTETIRNVLSNLPSDKIKYGLVVVEEFLRNIPTHGDMFNAQYAQDIYATLFALLHNPDPFVVNMAALTSAELACWAKKPAKMMPTHLTKEYFMMLLVILHKDEEKFSLSTARCLQKMLRVPQYQKVFVELDLIRKLVAVIEKKDCFQLQYQLIFCVWLLTFRPVVNKSLTRHNVVPVLSVKVNSTNHEKLNRIVCAVYRNLLEKSDNEAVIRLHIAAMINNKVGRQLKNMRDHPTADPEFEADLEYLEERLSKGRVEINTFELYEAELHSNRLIWTPLHRSEDFWKENVLKFDKNNFHILKKLIKILKDEHTRTVATCVACYDIGEYARHHPDGKKNIEILGGKTILMELMNNVNPKVRYEALLAVQKLMVRNWEFFHMPKTDSMDNTSQSSSGNSDEFRATPPDVSNENVAVPETTVKKPVPHLPAKTGVSSVSKAPDFASAIQSKSVIDEALQLRNDKRAPASILQNDPPSSISLKPGDIGPASSPKQTVRSVSQALDSASAIQSKSVIDEALQLRNDKRASASILQNDPPSSISLKPGDIGPASSPKQTVRSVSQALDSASAIQSKLVIDEALQFRNDKRAPASILQNGPASSISVKPRNISQTSSPNQTVSPVGKALDSASAIQSKSVIDETLQLRNDQQKERTLAPILQNEPASSISVKPGDIGPASSPKQTVSGKAPDSASAIQSKSVIDETLQWRNDKQKEQAQSLILQNEPASSISVKPGNIDQASSPNQTVSPVSKAPDSASAIQSKSVIDETLQWRNDKQKEQAQSLILQNEPASSISVNIPIDQASSPNQTVSPVSKAPDSPSAIQSKSVIDETLQWRNDKQKEQAPASILQNDPVSSISVKPEDFGQSSSPNQTVSPVSKAPDSASAIQSKSIIDATLQLRNDKGKDGAAILQNEPVSLISVKPGDIGQSSSPNQAVSPISKSPDSESAIQSKSVIDATLQLRNDNGQEEAPAAILQNDPASWISLKSEQVSHEPTSPASNASAIQSKSAIDATLKLRNDMSTRKERAPAPIRRNEPASTISNKPSEPVRTTPSSQPQIGTIPSNTSRQFYRPPENDYPACNHGTRSNQTDAPDDKLPKTSKPDGSK